MDLDLHNKPTNKGPRTKANMAEIGESGNSFPLYLPKILTVECEWRGRIRVL